MRWLRRFTQRTLSEKRLDSELQFHLEEQIADYIAAGLPPAEARRRACIEFGGVERFKEECRDTHPETHVESFLYDLRYACRNLRKDPRFFLLAVFALALGIGASAVIFSIVYNGVLHPFPYRGADRLVAIWLLDQDSPKDHQSMFTLPQIRAFRERNHSFEDVVGYSDWRVLYSSSSGAQKLHGCRVTSNAMEFFGVPPLLGRPLASEDVVPGATPAVVIDYRLWIRLFHADPAIIGKVMTLDSTAYTVVGVMPRRFTADGADFWAIVPPSVEQSTEERFDSEPKYYFASAILKRGASPAAAATDLDVIASQLAALYPREFPKKFQMTTNSLSDAVVADFKSVLYLLFAAVGLLLLISCSNVANLLLARATVREREIVLRASIGASRGRLVRQLLTETLVLAAVACTVGVLLAWGGLKVVIAKLPPRIPGEADISLNLAVLLFAITLSVVTVFLCGLSPALHAARGDYRTKLVGIGPGVQTSFRHSRLRSALVVAEVALAMVLLVCAGLMIRSFFALTHVNLGFDPSRVLIANLNFPRSLYSTAAEKNAYLDRILSSVSSIPGVVAVSPALGAPPLEGAGSRLTIPSKVHTEPWFTMVELSNEAVFQVLDLPLLKGRALTRADIASAAKVAVVNQAFAEKFFDKEDSLGQRFKLDVLDLLPEAPRDVYFEIVGIVSNIKNRGVADPTGPEVYIPFSNVGFGDRSLLIRTSVNPVSVLSAVRKRVNEVDRDVAFSDAASLSGMLSQALYSAPQFTLFAISSFATIALLLVVIGVFGLLAYTVTLQKHEFGIRMALGAQPANILRMVLGYGLRLIGGGIGVGMVVAFAIAWTLRHEFWQYTPADPLTYTVVALLLIGVGLVSCWVPARRATRVDPMIALRYE